ncbi:hypothetical protein [Nocardioides caricicola]|uniref:Glycosyl hydrolase family protein n=1 Tax=Nocardioides caricicola TaxID=634770 RepID=A0ABW0MXT0_9ACTN
MKRVLVTLTTAVLVASLASVPAEADHAHPPGPVHAGSTFGWGRAPVNYKFVGPLDRSRWEVSGRGNVGNQHGMLTLLADRNSTVRATEQTRGRAVGRWETRIRHRQYVHRTTPYRVLIELVPAGDRAHECGARNVALTAYTPGGKDATHYIHSRPDNRYVARRALNLADNQWHTFAVEVTRKRISWFVDAHVVSTEKRDAALSGVPFAVRYTMQAEDGRRMNESRIQMDWLRYWSLKNPNKKSTAAPRPKVGTNPDACAGRR